MDNKELSIKISAPENQYIQNKSKNENSYQIEKELSIVREREVLKLIAEGKSNKEIGNVLRISSKTAKCHRTNIMNKLDIHKVNELVSYAIKNGFVEV